MQKVVQKQKRSLAEEPEWKEFMEALKAAKSEPAFKEAIREFRKRHTGVE